MILILYYFLLISLIEYICLIQNVHAKNSLHILRLFVVFCFANRHRLLIGLSQLRQILGCSFGFTFMLSWSIYIIYMCVWATHFHFQVELPYYKLVCCTLRSISVHIAGFLYIVLIINREIYNLKWINTCIDI